MSFPLPFNRGLQCIKKCHVYCVFDRQTCLFLRHTIGFMKHFFSLPPYKYPRLTCTWLYVCVSNPPLQFPFPSALRRRWPEKFDFFLRLSSVYNVRVLCKRVYAYMQRRLNADYKSISDNNNKIKNKFEKAQRSIRPAVDLALSRTFVLSNTMLYCVTYGVASREKSLRTQGNIAGFLKRVN